MTSPRRPMTGFTLIEVMVAIVLMAVISLICWRAMDSVANASTRLEAVGERTAAVQRVLEQFRRDVEQRATTELPVLVTSRAMLDEDGRPIPQRLLPDAMASQRNPQGGFRLEIVRRAADRPGQWQRIAWWSARGTLYRAAGAASDRFPLAAPAERDGVAVLAEVSGFDVRAWEPAQGWRRLPFAGKSDAAQGLELRLRQRDEIGEASYRSVVLLR